MEQLSIYGGKPLRGIVTVSGSKNAALPILFATLLTDGETLLENLPDIADVRLALQILAEMGCRTERRGAGIAICTEGAQYRMPAPEAVGQMRASTYLLGGCLGRFGMCELPRPGGCNFGTRPIDLHCRALSALGAQFSTEGNCLVGKASGMHGAEVCFPTCSVGATVNTLLEQYRDDAVCKKIDRLLEIRDVANERLEQLRQWIAGNQCLQHANMAQIQTDPLNARSFQG